VSAGRQRGTACGPTIAGVRALLLPLVVALAVPVAAEAGARPPRLEVTTVSSTVSEACGRSATTADVAVRGRTVLATWTVGGGESADGNPTDLGLGQALSVDGGRTFARSARPLTTCAGGPLGFVVDPDVALGADGTPWLSASGALPHTDDAPPLQDGEPTGTVLVQVGDAAPVSVFPGVAAERGFLETDPRSADRGWVLGESLTRGRLRLGPVAGGQNVFGGPEGSLLLGATTDRGRSWQVTRLRPPSSPGAGLLALGLVRSGAALVALSAEFDLKDPSFAPGVVATGVPPVTVAAQTSLDEGRTWSAPVVLDVVGRGNLVDASAGDGLVVVSAPQADGSLLVWTSEDQGRTWRRTTAATGVAPDSPAVAVDRRGRVGALSYALDAVTGALTPQLSQSHDRGRTFTAPVALAAPFLPADVDKASHVHPMGPYQGADADGKDLLVAFTARGEGRLLEVRLARVS
jgi:hypothetical protein